MAPGANNYSSPMSAASTKVGTPANYQQYTVRSTYGAGIARVGQFASSHQQDNNSALSSSQASTSNFYTSSDYPSSANSGQKGKLCLPNQEKGETNENGTKGLKSSHRRSIYAGYPAELSQVVPERPDSLSLKYSGKSSGKTKKHNTAGVMVPATSPLPITSGKSPQNAAAMDNGASEKKSRRRSCHGGLLGGLDFTYQNYYPAAQTAGKQQAANDEAARNGRNAMAGKRGSSSDADCTVY